MKWDAKEFSLWFFSPLGCVFSCLVMVSVCVSVCVSSMPLRSGLWRCHQLHFHPLHSLKPSALVPSLRYGTNTHTQDPEGLSLLTHTHTNTHTPTARPLQPREKVEEDWKRDTHSGLLPLQTQRETHSLSTELDYLENMSIAEQDGLWRGLEKTERRQNTFRHEYRYETALTFHQLSQEHGGNLVKFYSFWLSGGSQACGMHSDPAYYWVWTVSSHSLVSTTDFLFINIKSSYILVCTHIGIRGWYW